MRNATFQEVGADRVYWIAEAIFAVMFGAMVFGWCIATKDRAGLAALASFFGVLVALGIAWPLWRVRERQGVRFTRIRSDQKQFDGVLVPASRAKRIVALIGAVVLAIGCAVLMPEGGKDRVKLLIGLVFFSGFAVVWVWKAFGRTHGVLLTEHGILWHKILEPAAFIPWNSVRAASGFLKREKYTSSLYLGVRVENITAVETPASHSAERAKAGELCGWHFEEDAETLLAPVAVIAAAIEFYAAHSELRHELVHGGAVDRIESLPEASIPPRLFSNIEFAQA
ncbi:MAG TPA: hypothetical protein VK530_00860 [Candidatus Acidoferrum sp.]|nr:hypothetical protein [Candidatus Acidoferrum sp.]